ncbi:MAG: energy transducer TonB [Spirochaetes bacterium]|nr:energy transducer TonB [Spirochaetota bacterium]
MSFFNNILIYFKNNRRAFYIFSVTFMIHLLLLFFVQIPKREKKLRKDNMIFKIVDITEYKKPEEKNVVEIAKQDKAVEEVIETKKEIKELDIDYLPQHKLSVLPVVPIEKVRSKAVYPMLAKKQGIEAIVYLELYIDQKGNIRNVKIIKDPGFGFGEAAVNAFKDIKCSPGLANGIAVPTFIRFPVQFKLK